MATNQAHSHGNSFAEKKKKKKEGFAWQCHTRQIKDNRTDLLKQTGLQILKKLQTLGSQINWSAKFKETTGETNLGSQITACIENGKSYW